MMKTTAFSTYIHYAVITTFALDRADCFKQVGVCARECMRLHRILWNAVGVQIHKHCMADYST